MFVASGEEGSDQFGSSAVSLEKTIQFSALLKQGPLEFYLGAEVSPSLRALRYAHEDEEMAFVDLVLATFYKYVQRKSPASERPQEMLQDVVMDASPNSLLFAEAHSVLGVYFADGDELDKSLHHFQKAVDAYRLRERDDALAVCFARHSLAMFEHGEQRAATRSLMRAESFASVVDRPLYSQYCQFVRLQGLYLQGRVEQAAFGAKELLSQSDMGPVFHSRLLALEYAGSVHGGDMALAEIQWQALQSVGHLKSPQGLIASRARAQYFLSQQRFTEAAEVTLHFLQNAPLASNRTKRLLIDELMSSRALKEMPESVSSLFDGLLLAVDIESKPICSCDVNLVCHPRDDL